MYTEYILNEVKPSELDTEIKFNIAGARAKGVHLIGLSFKEMDEEGKCITYLNKTLRAMQKSRTIEFYIEAKRMENGGAEVDFLFNKYGEYIDKNSTVLYYVKI